MRYLPLLLLLAACSPIQEVRGTVKARTWGRHHGAILPGVEVEHCNGVRAYVEGGRQFPVYAPGEPHVSSRAPSVEWQAQAGMSVPLWRRR